VKQEKDPLALWGGSPGPSGRGTVTVMPERRLKAKKNRFRSIAETGF
jgi:hypothetical protein